MNSIFQKKPLLIFCGPTGSGKTASSLYLVEHLLKTTNNQEYNSCVIINSDSRQLYKDFPIITAQPDHEEQKHCLHKLFGVIETKEKVTATTYSELAKKEIYECYANKQLPILVGGTGLYLKVLLEGIAHIPEIPEEISQYWRERCCLEGSVALHKKLEEVDGVLAKRLHPNDQQRIVRGLEVYTATQKALSEWQAEQKNSEPEFNFLKIGIGDSFPNSLSLLEPRLKLRIDRMLELGAIEEAQKAKAKCNDYKASGWSGIGCSELYQYLNNELTIEECKQLWYKNTRAYAKRQLTWFKADKEIHWFKPDDMESVLALAIKFITC
ncbi:tRNA (adenosine(37)-N6)-dimethylallyltransferase MiaA [Desulfovibrio litoralis]|uniref:tRNA dimethylallyltransferase n=1 Tax=Desulfovibrio litoralis DSM 11393 TaxID=1121455 RepID=A0A1M7SLV8_9BACT|nr:tRNA (adenosine(37)-N6)-dimethylallyltransferase MiaA [Desulfovibrio litoralis]SHN59457.1 tRNA dimethylallyltransferase [Desulfovibrio litoralis DSM 11393]